MTPPKKCQHCGQDVQMEAPADVDATVLYCWLAFLKCKACGRWIIWQGKLAK